MTPGEERDVTLVVLSIKLTGETLGRGLVFGTSPPYPDFVKSLEVPRIMETDRVRGSPGLNAQVQFK